MEHLADNNTPKSAYEGLSEADREGLRRSASDLSDIEPDTLRRIEAGFAQAYQRAQEIADGTRAALDSYDGA